MTKDMIKTIKGETGELLAVIDGRRYVIAKCRPSIELYEIARSVNVLGSVKCQVKKMHAAIVLCVDREITTNLDASQWENATEFELTGNFEREDRVIEGMTLKNIAPLSQDLTESIWEFEVNAQDADMKKLLNF